MRSVSLISVFCYVWDVRAELNLDIVETNLPVLKVGKCGHLSFSRG